MKPAAVLLLAVLPFGKPSPAVNQANIRVTICAKRWTETVRPPRSYTRRLKKQQMRAMHLRGKPKDYEEDHVIPLEVGGDPRSVDNLRPQRWPEAKKKDRVENWLHVQVCTDKMTLIEAQQSIRIWPDLYKRLTGKRP